VSGTPLEVENEEEDHLESVGEPRHTKEHFEGIKLPTDIQDQNGEQLLAKERLNRGRRKVQTESRSNTWDSGQLIPSAAQRQAGSAPDQSHVAEQEGTVNPAGETTGILTDKTMDNIGNETRSELKRQWDDKSIFPWGNQDGDPDAVAVQSNEETMRAPPIMALLQHTRPQHHRRMPCRLEDYKLRRVKRARHSQVSSPTERNCSQVTLENSEPVLHVMTLHCNMI